MKKPIKVITTVSDIFDRIAGIAVVLMMIVVVYNVIVRAINNLLPKGLNILPSIIGEQDFVGLLMSIAVSFALAACALKGGHIAITIIYDKMPPIARFIIDLIIGILSFLFFSIFSYRIFFDASTKYKIGEVSMTAAIYTWPFIIATGIGLVLLFITIVITHIHTIKKGVQQ